MKTRLWLASVLAMAQLCALSSEAAAKTTQTARIAKPRPPEASAEVKTENPKDVVQGFYDQLLVVMKQGENLGFSGRYDKIKPAIDNAFDMSAMARFAAGTGWLGAKPDEQAKLVSSFGNFSAATYASRFKKYGGEKLEVLGSKPGPDGAMIVETRLVPGDGDAAVTLNYLLRRDAQQKWRINDVYLDATISELATRRSEFGAVIRDQGMEALIDNLDRKTKDMRES